jgi:2'-5' RNA ligase
VSELIRSFIAVEIDNGDIIKRITDAQNILGETGAQLKFVEPENIHVTVRFLGEIAKGMVERVFEEMEKVSFKPFEIQFNGVGTFPNLNRPSVVWIGISKGVDALSNIFNQLEPKLHALGFAPDSRGFSPHVTIARVNSGLHRAELIQAITSLRELEFGTLHVDSIRLKKSVLTPKGPIYSTLHEVKA